MNIKIVPQAPKETSQAGNKAHTIGGEAPSFGPTRQPVK